MRRAWASFKRWEHGVMWFPAAVIGACFVAALLALILRHLIGWE